MQQSNKKGILYLIPTFIAEGTDFSEIPAQVKQCASDIDYFLVENVRTTRRYFSKLKMGRPIEDLHFEVLDKKTDETALKSLMAPIFEGKNMGIVSESGCPGIADPGALAVNFAHKNDIRVIPIVGPSSLLLALMASGLNGQSFTFHGYLPIQKKEASQRIKQLEQDSRKKNETQLFIETPYRNNQLLDALLSTCRSDTRICVARGINGDKELIKTASVSDWKKLKMDLHKIPTVFLLLAN